MKARLPPMTEQNSPLGPIELAQEPDLSLGALQVSPSIREVTREGQRQSLEPKAMQVLVALGRTPGRVVSRDELIARCWDGRIVGEDAINRVIGRLRRLSEEDDGRSFVIETIPRVGFRLLAIPAPLATESADEQVAPNNLPRLVAISRQQPIAPAPTDEPRDAVKPQTKVGVTALIVLGCLAILGGGTAAWLFWPSAHLQVTSSRSFLSSLALEDYPAISPNGATLAYSSTEPHHPRKIYVRNFAGGDGTKITSDALDDVSPSWSSDGARLAYVAQKLGEPCHIMVVTVPGGEAREAGRCAVHYISWLCWQPGSSFVYFLDGKDYSEDRVIRLNVDSGERTVVPGTTATNALVDIRCSPDGKSLAYLPLVGQNYPIIVHDLATNKETILAKLPQSSGGSFGDSLTWSEDSKAVLVSVANGVGSEITAYPVDGAAAYPVYTSASTITHMSAGGGQLAVAVDIGRKNLARVSATPASQPDTIDPSNGVTRSPTFAPDGTLAFISNRSGTNAVWTMKPGGPPQLLYDAGFRSLIRVEYSPDGTRLVLTSFTPSSEVAYQVLSAGGAVVQTFTTPTSTVGLPTWTPDSKGLIAYDNNRAMRVDVSNPANRVPVAPPQWDGVTIRSQGTFATRYDQFGLWQIDKGIKKINSIYPSSFAPNIAFRGNDAIVPDFKADGGPRVMAQPLPGGDAQLIGYAPGALYLNSGFTSGFAVNPTNGEIIYVAAVLSDTNIDLYGLSRR